MVGCLKIDFIGGNCVCNKSTQLLALGSWLWVISLLGCLVVQNSASGDGVLAQPKVSDVAYIRDTYFSSVYEMVNNSMTANVAPNTTLRGKHQAVLLSVLYSFCIGMVQWYIGHMLFCIIFGAVLTNILHYALMQSLKISS